MNREIIDRHKRVAYHDGFTCGLPVGFLLGITLAIVIWELVR